MSQNLQSFMRGTGMLRSVVNRVPADAWDQPSCCEGWTAREVAGHITWGLRSTGGVAAGDGMAEQAPEAEIAGADPAASVTAAIDDAIAALDQPGAIQRDTPFGMPMDAFLSLMAVDSMIHAWDIADATGIDHGIDGASATAALAAMAPMAERMRGPGRFDDAVITDSDDPVDQLIAFLGRTSVRS